MDDEKFNITQAQIKTLGRMLSKNAKARQVGDNIIVDTHFTDFEGSMSDGPSSQKRITYEIRTDGKRRMLSRDRTAKEHGDWVDPTKRDNRRKWH